MSWPIVAFTAEFRQQIYCVGDLVRFYCSKQYDGVDAVITDTTVDAATPMYCIEYTCPSSGKTKQAKCMAGNLAPKDDTLDLICVSSGRVSKNTKVGRKPAGILFEFVDKSDGGNKTYRSIDRYGNWTTHEDMFDGFEEDYDLDDVKDRNDFYDVGNFRSKDGIRSMLPIANEEELRVVMEHYNADSSAMRLPGHLINTYHAEMMKLTLCHEDFVWILRINGIIVGFLFLQGGDNMCRYIHPRFAGKGLGTWAAANAIRFAQGLRSFKGTITFKHTADNVLSRRSAATLKKMFPTAVTLVLERSFEEEFAMYKRLEFQTAVKSFAEEQQLGYPNKIPFCPTGQDEFAGTWCSASGMALKFVPGSAPRIAFDECYGYDGDDQYWSPLKKHCDGSDYEDAWEQLVLPHETDVGPITSFAYVHADFGMHHGISTVVIVALSADSEIDGIYHGIFYQTN
jgi:hypothetical protein